MAKSRITAGQTRAMLARVTTDLKTETDPDRASDLRILKMKIESHLRILSKLGEGRDGAPPGVTIH